MTREQIAECLNREGFRPVSNREVRFTPSRPGTGLPTRSKVPVDFSLLFRGVVPLNNLDVYFKATLQGLENCRTFASIEQGEAKRAGALAAGGGAAGGRAG